MSSKINQVHIWGIFNTTKVRNACLVVSESKYNVVYMLTTDAFKEVGMA